MKKILSFVLAASICISVFAADVFKFVPIQGNVESYTKTEYTIASKFGNYFRTPSMKYNHKFDSNGLEIESTELTAKDIELNSVKSTYDTLGNLKSQICKTAEGEILWRSEVAYKNGVKTELSEYNSKNELISKTIYTYSDGLLVDESSYNGEGALLWKTKTSYKDDKIEKIDEYMPSGLPSEKAQFYYNENGTIDSISHFDAITTNISQEVFRYSENGQLNEITTYTDDKQVTKRIQLKYDAKGNVNKVITYNVAQKFGTIVNEIVAIVDYDYIYGDDSVAEIPEL